MLKEVLSFFDIPESCFVGKKVFKKLFFENYRFNAIEKKIFNEDIVEITWIYSLKPETINIPVYKDDEREYLEIAYLQITLSKKTKIKQIAEIIHRSITYPLVLVFVFENEYLICVSPKFINKADMSKTTIGKILHTDWINIKKLNKGQSTFITNISLKMLPYDNLFEFYSKLVDNVIDLNCFGLGEGQSNLCLNGAEKQKILESIVDLEDRIKGLKKELEKEVHINRKVEINIEIRNIETVLYEERKKI